MASNQSTVSTGRLLSPGKWLGLLPIAALQGKEQAQEDAKAALKTATATLDAEVGTPYPEFSSLVDLLRGAVGNTTPAGKQLTNIRKLVTGSAGGGGGGSSSISSGGGSSSSS